MNEETRIREERRIKTGGFAFPQNGFYDERIGEINTLPAYSPDAGGMTLRDWLAGIAMQAFLKKTDFSDRQVAKSAYKMADAMIEQRDNKCEEPVCKCDKCSVEGICVRDVQQTPVKPQTPLIKIGKATLCERCLSSLPTQERACLSLQIKEYERRMKQ